MFLCHESLVTCCDICPQLGSKHRFALQQKRVRLLPFSLCFVATFAHSALVAELPDQGGHG